jgi:hypothetical protein
MPKYLIAVALLAAGCGPKVEEEQQLLERRLVTCEALCTTVMNPECVNPYNDPESHAYIESKDKCLEFCAAPNTPKFAYWGYEKDESGDGVDRCYDEAKATYACQAQLSCEELNFTYANEPGATPGRACDEPELEAMACYQTLIEEARKG